MSVTTEDELFESYRVGSRYVTRCACGLCIESPTASEVDVTRAVNLHNSSTVHQRWGEWQEALLAARGEAA